jgi:hypothetical protein
MGRGKLPLRPVLTSMGVIVIDNSYYSQVHRPYEMHDIDNLELEEGGTLASGDHRRVV